ncbi:hypothetical protein ACJMK2_006384 [Sinanodonta woodiana]|uniref:Uncharacterized protein n=1 Tax=Sinanodonta woodiana TaxID=1069815 RepID=A0ABD3VW68_SINWO
MHTGRILKLKRFGVIFFILSVVSLGIRFIYQRNISEMSMEQVIQRSGISLCTPCQYLDHIKTTDSLASLNSDAFHVAHYKTFPPIKLTKLEDLQTSGEDRIQKILHQKWNTINIPIQFRDYVKSFIDNHPTWQYMFWTDQSTRHFIQDHFSNLLSLYDNFGNPLNRADSMRYMLLFYYGRKYSCFLAQEPHVHSIVFSNFYEQASTALVENLYAFFHFANEHDSTGPRYLTFLFRQYSRQNRDMEKTDDEYVYLSPPEYFNLTVDPGVNNLLAMPCSGVSCLSSLRKWQCEQWRFEGVKSEPYIF